MGTRLFNSKTDPLDLAVELRELTANTSDTHLVHDCTETAPKYLNVLKSKAVEGVTDGVREMVLFSTARVQNGDMLKLKKAEGGHVLRMVFDVEAVGSKKDQYRVHAVSALLRAGIGHAISPG